MAGIAAGVGEYHGYWSACSLTILLCLGISLSNAIELLLLITTGFRHRAGLYFWSLFLTTLSLLPYSVGFLLVYFRLYSVLVGDIMNNVGWAVLITGQSMVLYSRLGVIYQNHRVLRLVLAMILMDGFILYTATTVIHYGTYTDIGVFTRAAPIMERIQMTGFSIQETIISGLYLREVARYQRIVGPILENARRTIWELLVINIILIAMDVALLTLVYMGFGPLEQAFKALSYSFKLKMEFAILGKLVEMARAKRISECTTDAFNGWNPEFTFIDRSKSETTQTSFG